MIYMEHSEISRYYGISENLDKALAFLQKSDLTKLENGRNEVSGEDVYINRFDYTTLPESEAFFEAHARYADIHVLLAGKEQIAVSDVNTLTETQRDEETDFVGYSGSKEAVLNMNPSKILIVFPAEAHMVKLQLGEPSLVQKAVFKVKI